MDDEISRETLQLIQGQERIRQIQETFNQRKRQDERWFLLRLAFGYASAVSLLGISVLCGWMILHHKDFSAASVTAATSALLVDTLGVILSVWKVVIGNGLAPLAPLADEQHAQVETKKA